MTKPPQNMLLPRFFLSGSKLTQKNNLSPFTKVPSKSLIHLVDVADLKIVLCNVAVVGKKKEKWPKKSQSRNQTQSSISVIFPNATLKLI